MRPRVSRQVSLQDLLDTRDASIRVSGSHAAAAWVRVRRQLAGRFGAAGRALLTVVSVLLGQAYRHGLVLAGLTSFVVAAAQHSTIAALITTGVSLFFLELRRR